MSIDINYVIPNIVVNRGQVSYSPSSYIALTNTLSGNLYGIDSKLLSIYSSYHNDDKSLSSSLYSTIQTASSFSLNEAHEQIVSVSSYLAGISSSSGDIYNIFHTADKNISGSLTTSYHSADKSLSGSLFTIFHDADKNISGNIHSQIVSFSGSLYPLYHNDDITISSYLYNQITSSGEIYNNYHNDDKSISASLYSTIQSASSYSLNLSHNQIISSSASIYTSLHDDDKSVSSYLYNQLVDTSGNTYNNYHLDDKNITGSLYSDIQTASSYSYNLAHNQITSVSSILSSSIYNNFHNSDKSISSYLHNQITNTSGSLYSSLHNDDINLSSTLTTNYHNADKVLSSGIYSLFHNDDKSVSANLHNQITSTSGGLYTLFHNADTNISGTLTTNYHSADKTISSYLHNQDTSTSASLYTLYHNADKNISGYIPYRYSGTTSCPTYHDNLNGSVTIGNGYYSLSRSITAANLTSNYYLSGGTFTLTDNSINYIIANYNSGSPALQLTTNRSIIDGNFVSIVPVYTIYRSASSLIPLDWDESGLFLSEKLLNRIINNNRFERDVNYGGLILSEAATRTVIISAGKIWYGVKSQLLTAFNSSLSGQVMKLYYHSGGNWTSTNITQYNNTQYDDGTNLQSTSSNRYVVNWVYECVSETDLVFIVLGGANYKLAEAQASVAPTLPSIISSTAVLVGRIIVQQGASSSTEIDSAFTTSLGTGTATNHNDLMNIQSAPSGVAGEYYHTSSDQATVISKLSSLTTGTSAYVSAVDFLNNVQSSGRITGGAITAHSPADGTVDISILYGMIKITNTVAGPIRFFRMPAQSSLALTDGYLNYLYYNYSTNSVLATTDRTTIHDYDQFTIGRAYRDGTTVDIVSSGTNIYNAYRRIHNRLVKKYGFDWASGAQVAETGSRYITVTPGVWFIGNTEIDTLSINTSTTSTLTTIYHSGGTYTKTTGVTQLGNTQYDNGTNLATLTNNRYGVYFIYICPQSDIYALYGQGDYLLPAAQAAAAPSVLPNYLTQNAVLIAKIIFLKGATNFYDVIPLQRTSFPVNNAASHNDLGGLQGGTTSEYYHLTNSLYNYLLPISSTIINLHSQITSTSAALTTNYHSADKTLSGSLYTLFHNADLNVSGSIHNQIVSTSSSLYSTLHGNDKSLSSTLYTNYHADDKSMSASLYSTIQSASGYSFNKAHSQIISTSAALTTNYHNADKALSAAMGSSSIATSIVETISSNSHGFTSGNINQPITKLANGTYTLSKGDTAANAEYIGLFTSYIDSNRFKVTSFGDYTWTSHGFVGPAIVVSDITAGALMETLPSVGNWCSIAAIVKDNNTLMVVNRSPYQVIPAAGAAAYVHTFTSSELLSGQLTLVHNLGVQVVPVTIADNSGNQILPKNIQFSNTNQCVVDLGTVITVTGTWTATIFMATGGLISNNACNGRLTLTSGAPVLTTDVTAATTVYFTPYNGNQIDLYNGTFWNRYQFNELSLSIAGYTASTLYDIFIYNNSGVLTLSSTAWSNSGAGTSTRATALVYQNGILVKSGATTYRYLGTIMTTSTTGQTEVSFGQTAGVGGSAPKCLVWNYYNRIQGQFSILNSTNTYTYTTGTWRQMYNSSNSQFNFVVGISGEKSMNMTNTIISSNTTNASRLTSWGINSTSTPQNPNTQNNTNGESMTTNMLYSPALGFSYVAPLEYSVASGTSTWWGVPYGCSNLDFWY